MTLWCGDNLVSKSISSKKPPPYRLHEKQMELERAACIRTRGDGLNPEDGFAYFPRLDLQDLSPFATGTWHQRLIIGSRSVAGGGKPH
jgi:hypothetical protein